MRLLFFYQRVLPFVAALALCGVVHAQQQPTEETPYVPSPRGVVDTMLTLAGVRAGDYLIDLGSGNGVIILTAAARYGASGMGVEIDPRLVRLSNESARSAGLAARARFVEQDLFKTDISPATVLTLYLLPEFNMALRSTILDKLKPGTRVVSHDADMGDWLPEASTEVQVPEKTVGVRKSSMVYMWTVPAKVEGRWRLRVGAGAGKGGEEAIDIDLVQTFQELSGRAAWLGQSTAVQHGFVHGRVVSFSLGMGADALLFTGRADGARIAGSVIDARGRTQRWSATRPATVGALSLR
jgi:16S rRNA G966 N2-methylase RsmD